MPVWSGQNFTSTGWSKPSMFETEWVEWTPHDYSILYELATEADEPILTEAEDNIIISI